jgi:hypothetical protein
MALVTMMHGAHQKLVPVDTSNFYCYCVGCKGDFGVPCFARSFERWFFSLSTYVIVLCRLEIMLVGGTLIAP